MDTNTSIGPGPDQGGNQDQGNADGLGNKTLGEHGMPEPEEGNAAAAPSRRDLPPQPGEDPRDKPTEHRDPGA